MGIYQHNAVRWGSRLIALILLTLAGFHLLGGSIGDPDRNSPWPYIALGVLFAINGFRPADSKELPGVALLLLVVGCGHLPAAAIDAPSPPIVILLADDAGYVDFGFTGLKGVSTPHIDSIAAEGVVCSQGYVCASVCSPSRAGLLTGRYPQRFGHEMNLPAGSKLGLPLSEKTLADRLGERGYTTGAIGKWHLGEAAPFRPLERGFDEFHGFLGGARPYFDSDRLTPRTRWREGDETTAMPAPYATDAIGEAAADFIRRHKETPFFLYVAFNAVHTPMHILEEDLAKVPRGGGPKRRKLLAMTIALDRAVGKVLKALEESGIGDETLVFFLNDNGGATTNASDNGPLRGMKGSKFEGGVRVPWATRWRDHLPKGAKYVAPVTSLDIAATALGAAGAATVEAPALDGVDLFEALKGEQPGPVERHLFWRRSLAAAVRQGPWKLIRVESLEPQLFNLLEDPGETTDLSASNEERVSDLLGALSKWEEQLVDPLWQTGAVWRRNQVEKHRIDFIGREKERSRP